MRRLTGFALATIVALAAFALPARAATIADGPTASDGQRQLTVSATELAATGQVLHVTGSGYDTFKGIYIAFCVIPPTNQAPRPCGGGIDTGGGSGASQWISSNPPPYGVGVAVPYGPGGSFDVQIAVSPQLNPSVDCRRVRCAVVTRNDHVRSTDRTQDLFVPVSFASAPVEVPANPTPTDIAPAPVPSTPSTDTTVIETTTSTLTPNETSTTGAPTTAAASASDEQELAAAQHDAPSNSFATFALIAGALLVVATVLGSVLVVRHRRTST